MIDYAYSLDGAIVHIDDAEKQTDYVCSDCEAILHVKDGAIKAKHFFHLNAEECGGTGESLIHKYWKDRIANMKKISLPKPVNILQNHVSYEFETYKIVGSKEEVRFLDGRYIADVVLTLEVNQRTFDVFIEVCYKNPKTEDYLEHWRKLGNAVFEIMVNENRKVKTKLLYSKKIEDTQAKLNLERLSEQCKDEFRHWYEKVLGEIEPRYHSYVEPWNKVEFYGDYLKRVEPIKESFQRDLQKYKQKYQSGNRVSLGMNVGNSFAFKHCYIRELYYVLQRYSEQEPFKYWTQQGIKWRLHLSNKAIKIMNQWLFEEDKGFNNGWVLTDNTFKQV